jgi:hypothetical protein
MIELRGGNVFRSAGECRRATQQYDQVRLQNDMRPSLSAARIA